MTGQKDPIYAHPVEILQQLIRFDTTNPPGNELECIRYIQGLLNDAGIRSVIHGKTKERANLVARIKGQGKAAPLLLYGHVDVVTTANQKWSQPPFAGNIVDDVIWGRGALDMKSGVAMFLAAFLKAKAENTPLPGDVIFCALADEENGGDFGARFMAAEHPDLFEDVKYALGEFGGFNINLSGKRVYPIMIAEKQVCWLKLTFRGKGGRGSMPVHGQAMAKLARALKILDEKQLPYHLTPAVQIMIDAMAAVAGGAAGMVLGQLKNPLAADRIIKTLGTNAAIFGPLLHNTVSPTIVNASEKINVIPSEVTLQVDGRMVPGMKPEDLQNELRSLLGDDVEMSVQMFNPGPAEPILDLMDTLQTTLQELDPTGTAIPFVIAGATDARFFSDLGIQTYGFTPLKLPDDFSFMGIIHSADERVPVDAVSFGAEAVFSAIQKGR